MIWTRIYDPTRNPAHWTELVAPGQFAVFIFDAPTHVARDAAGGHFNPPDSVSLALCDNLPEALAFAKDVVTHHPNLFCEIYDEEGKSKDPVQAVYNPAVRGKYVGLQYSRRQTLWGSLAMLAGIAFIVLDIMRDLAWFWGYIIGMKLTLVGGFRVTQGLLGWYEHRREAR